MTFPISIGKYLLNSLHSKGIECIFGVPGDYVLELDKQIEEHPIRFINATREDTAGYMADAYGRMRGLGVACITYGVGLTISIAVAQAYVESSPLFIISGSPSKQQLKHGVHLHHLIHQKNNNEDTTQLDIFKHITIGQAVLNEPQTAKEQIDSLIELCMKKMKPVYLEIPSDIVNHLLPATLEIERKKFIEPKSHSPSLNSSIEATCTLLNACHSPFIWAGHEIERLKLSSKLLEFAVAHQIPIVTSLLGKSLIDETHPLALGVYQGNMSRPELTAYLKQCDCLIMLGLVLTDLETGIFTAKLDYPFLIKANSEKIEIQGKIFKDIQLPDFIKSLAKDANIQLFKPDLTAIKKIQPSFIPQKETFITSKRIFDCVQSHLKDDHLVFADIGDCLFGSSELILKNRQFMACAHYGALGFATPGSLGVQFAAPDVRVIALIGDGAFQMTCTELSTAVRYHLDPILIIFNNHGYGTERPLLEGSYNDIQDWNYSQLPLLINGGKGIQVKTEEELDHALKTALSHRGMFYLIEVLLDKYDFSPPLCRFSALAAEKRISS